MDTNNLYQRLRQYRGSIGEVAKRYGCNRNWVRFVTQGIYTDPKLIKVAIKVIEERYKEEKTTVLQAQSAAEQYNPSVLRPSLQTA
jgi:hypothetical protein